VANGSEQNHRSQGEGTTMKVLKLAAIPALALAAGIGLTACGGTTVTVTPAAPAATGTTPAAPAPAAASPAGPAASSTWSTACDVLSPDQFQLYVTNNTDQTLTPPGWTILLFDQDVQVGDSDDAGLGPVLGGANSASPYAGSDRTVSSNVWTLPSIFFTSCEVMPYQGG